MTTARPLGPPEPYGPSAAPGPSAEPEPPAPPGPSLRDAWRMQADSLLVQRLHHHLDAWRETAAAGGSPPGVTGIGTAALTARPALPVPAGAADLLRDAGLSPWWRLPRRYGRPPEGGPAGAPAQEAAAAVRALFADVFEGAAGKVPGESSGRAAAEPSGPAAGQPAGQEAARSHAGHRAAGQPAGEAAGTTGSPAPRERPAGSCGGDLGRASGSDRGGPPGGASPPPWQCAAEVAAEAGAWWLGFFAVIRHRGVHHRTREPRLAPLHRDPLLAAARVIAQGVTARVLRARLRAADSPEVRAAYCRAVVAGLAAEVELPVLLEELGETRLVDLVSDAVPWSGQFARYAAGTGSGRVA